MEKTHLLNQIEKLRSEVKFVEMGQGIFNPHRDQLSIEEAFKGKKLNNKKEKE